PPEDGGFKYNPPNGGPADTDVTGWVQDRANQLVRAGNAGVKRVPLAAAVKAATTRAEDFVLPYVRDLGSVIDMDSIRAAGLKLGVDPLGGASLHYWESIEAVFHLNITVVNPRIDPTFAFMTLDHDGKIRMDCSSPYAMAGLVRLKDHYQVAFGNDPDADRHGIVTPSGGLMNPNHFLAVAIRYLLTHRPDWPAQAGAGKTLVSSSMIDRAVHHLARGGQRDPPSRRADPGPPDPRPGERRADRRPEGGARERLVRRPALRHRGHHQALRRELQKRGPPGGHHRRSPAARSLRD